MLLAKYKYLKAQIFGKFVKQNKVGEYLVFSLFSYRRLRPPHLPRTTTICFSHNATSLESPQNFTLLTFKNILCVKFLGSYSFDLLNTLGVGGQ